MNEVRPNPATGFGLFSNATSTLLIISDEPDPDWLIAAAAATPLRLVGVIPMEKAPERLSIQVGCDIILLVCGQDRADFERRLSAIELHTVQNQIELIIIASIDRLDQVFASSHSPRTQILCAPEDADLANALLLAVAQSTPRLFHDVARENDETKFGRLSEEVSRLASTIETLVSGRGQANPSFFSVRQISDKPSDYIGLPARSHQTAQTWQPHHSRVSATQVRSLLRARRLRDDFLPGDLFSDPAWDILLDLLAAHLEQARVSVSSLCIASCVPPTTALRCIRILTDKGLIVRQPDLHDNRRVFVAITAETADRLVSWFDASHIFSKSGDA
ncbi:MarR family transcriptional regulator [Sphingobium sp. AN558]|uniref:MarR family transcriptional regulator n=1 Tax=Sphingobium sp. AN558 TaxID=3133442 RepID=UPI0030C25389